MVLVCVPFMILVYLLQTRAFTVITRKLYEKGSSSLTFLHHALVGGCWEPEGASPDCRTPQPPPKGRKRRLMSGGGGGGGGGVSAGGTRTAGIRGAWSWWMRRGPGAEDTDLGKV